MPVTDWKKEDTRANGQSDFSEGGGGMQLHVQSKQAPAEPFLKDFWGGEFEGQFDCDTQIGKKFGLSSL